MTSSQPPTDQHLVIRTASSARVSRSLTAIAVIAVCVTVLGIVRIMGADTEGWRTFAQYTSNELLCRSLANAEVTQRSIDKQVALADSSVLVDEFIGYALDGLDRNTPEGQAIIVAYRTDLAAAKDKLATASRHLEAAGAALPIRLQVCSDANPFSPNYEEDPEP